MRRVMRFLREQWAILLILGIVAAVSGWLLTSREPVHSTPASGAPGHLAQPAVPERPIISGRIVDQQTRRPIAGARIQIAFYATDAKMLWQSAESVTGGDGKFYFQTSDFPRIPLSSAVLLTAEAANHLYRKQDLRAVIESGSGNLSFEPAQVTLTMAPYEPTLMVWFFVPALIGVLFSIIHLTSWGGRSELTFTFTMSSSVVWGFVIYLLMDSYRRHGHVLIPLFFDDVFVNTGVVVFAYVGAFVYAAYSVYQRKTDFLSPELSESRRRLMLTIGTRLWVAPYVAAVAQILLAQVYPNVAGGAGAVFFGFFTGLYIKVVLEWLNDVGSRFLSLESAQRVQQHLASSTASSSSAASSSAKTAEPNRNFLEALARAERELLPKPGVIGVVPGKKLSETDTDAGRDAVVIYVYQKREMAADDPNRIPSEIGGVPTDVREIPDAPDGLDCHPVLSQLDWIKIAADHDQAAPRRPLVVAPAAPPLTPVGDVLVLHDHSGGEYFFDVPTGDENSFFNPLRAFSDCSAIRAPLRDQYDFLAFVLDRESVPVQKRQADHYVPVWNEFSGISFHRERAAPDTRFDRRIAWGAQKLRGCQVHLGRPLITKMLHEIGHCWSAYVQPSARLLTEDGFHWREALNNATSCMDRDKIFWVRQSDGRFIKESVSVTEPGFSLLDLYLMGLATPEEVKELELITPVALDPDGKWKASVETIPMADVIGANRGPRTPAWDGQPKLFRIAYIVVTMDMERGISLAEQMTAAESPHSLKALEARFREATLKRAALSTALI